MDCPVCHGKGWVKLATGWPVECADCTPTKLVKGRVTLDKGKVAAILKRRQEDEKTRERHGFIPLPPFVDDRAPERIYDYD